LKHVSRDRIVKANLSLGRTAASAILLLTGAACVTGGAARSGDARRVDMEPMQFVARKTPAGVVVLHRDAESLFRAAGAALEQDRPLEAVLKYETLLAEFPASAFAGAARYNLGLAYEKAGRFLAAAAAFERVVAQAETPKDALDARFRIAGCYESLEDWSRAVATLERILLEPTLTDEEQAEARVRLGMALLETRHLDEAEGVLQAVIGRRKTGPPRPLLMAKNLLAQAQYGLARIDHLRFSGAPIRLGEIMASDIQEKARTFLKAQSSYLRTMSYKDRLWSSASGLKIGTLYEDFYNDLMAAPVPPELTHEESEVYFEELRRVIRPLVERAIFVYEKNLRLAEGLGADDDVLDETQSRLDRLRDYLQPTPEEQPPGSDPAAPATTGEPAPETG